MDERAREDGTGRNLIDVGLLSPFRSAGGTWWAPHRLVVEMVGERWEGDVVAVHGRLGRWFQEEFEETKHPHMAQRAVEYFCTAGDGDAAWPTAESLAIWLRTAGRYREALSWVERVLDAGASGPQRGMALMAQVQLQRLAGSLSSQGEGKLQEALKLVNREDRGDVLHELGGRSAIACRWRRWRALGGKVKEAEALAATTTSIPYLRSRNRASLDLV